MTPGSDGRRDAFRRIGLVGGPVLASIVYVAAPALPASTAAAGATAGLEPEGCATLALMVWMAVWWLTEAIDVAATALLPLAILPLATHAKLGSAAAAMQAAATPYANPLIALFLGGFLIALAMERWGLHRRIALIALGFVGTRPAGMVAGFMAVTAVMSMWVSNTATTVMMLPIALSVTGLLRRDEPREDDRNLARCLMLGIAYAASVGGIGTLIGTPPNLLLAGFARTQLGVEIGFARWLAIGLPLVAVFVPLIWLLLTRVAFPVGGEAITGGRALIRAERARLGPMKPGEWATFLVFMATASAWIGRPLLNRVRLGDVEPFAGLTDAGIAIIAALLLFVIPVARRRLEFVLDWETARRVPWGILILFGGGLSLADAVSDHGVAGMFGVLATGLGGLPPLLVLLLVTSGVIFLTELTSNTATTATLLPILAGAAPALGMPPMLLLVPAAIAASCAFMMPVATPPNAIVFGAGHVTIPEMCRAGFLLNLSGIVLVTLLAYGIVIPLLGL